MNLFDASALLIFVQNEPGAEVVERRLREGGACSSVNWSETAQKVIARSGDFDLVKSLLFSYGVSIESVMCEDAEQAARLWSSGDGLSLADRICLATARRLGAVVWTADTAWGTGANIRQIR